MNAVREINRINQQELELGVAGKGSWHDEYKDSAYVFIGGLPYDLTEGDVITIFSQFGEVMDINMPRDKETGKTKGFGFLMYEDQRSTVLAVDNMNGTQIIGRTIRVDHCKKYKQKGERDDDGKYVEPEEPTYNAMPPTLEGSDESESSGSEAGDSVDEEDPMAAFIKAEKKKAKAITNGDKKRKHDGETKEERRARKEAKKAKRAAKEAKRARKAGIKLEDDHPRYDRRSGRDREERGERDRSRKVDDDCDRYRRRDRSRDKDREEYSGKAGRGNRDDWREGRWELERDEMRSRAREDPSDRDSRRPRDDRGRDRNGHGDRRGEDREERHRDYDKDRRR